MNGPAIPYAPRIRQMYWCRFPETEFPNEFGSDGKRRPVVINSKKNRLHGTVIVVPFSTAEQTRPELATKLKSPLNGMDTWAVCSHPTTVSSIGSSRTSRWAWCVCRIMISRGSRRRCWQTFPTDGEWKPVSKHDCVKWFRISCAAFPKFRKHDFTIAICVHAPLEFHRKRVYFDGSDATGLWRSGYRPLSTSWKS